MSKARQTQEAGWLLPLVALAACLPCLLIALVPLVSQWGGWALATVVGAGVAGTGLLAWRWYRQRVADGKAGLADCCAEHAQQQNGIAAEGHLVGIKGGTRPHERS
jgi:hypothetical protein